MPVRPRAAMLPRMAGGAPSSSAQSAQAPAVALPRMARGGPGGGGGREDWRTTAGSSMAELTRVSYMLSETRLNSVSCFLWQFLT